MPQSSFLTTAALPAPRLYPLGESAVVLEFGTVISEATNDTIRAVANYLQAHPFPGLGELVPAFTTLTVFYDPWQVRASGAAGSPFEAVAAILQDRLARLPPMAAEAKTGPAVEIPVCYGGEFGPDLEAVARHCGLSEAEVVARHAGADYRVYFIGFAPGFPLPGRPARRAGHAPARQPAGRGAGRHGGHCRGPDRHLLPAHAGRLAADWPHPGAAVSARSHRPQPVTRGPAAAVCAHHGGAVPSVARRPRPMSLHLLESCPKEGRELVARSSSFAHCRTESSRSQQRHAKLELRVTALGRKYQST